MAGKTVSYRRKDPQRPMLDRCTGQKSEFQQQQAEEAAEREREEAERRAEKELDFSRRRAAKQAEQKGAAEVIYRFIIVSLVSVPVAALGALCVILGLDQLAGFGISPGPQLAQLLVISSFILT